jgi:hypothetical protein
MILTLFDTVKRSAYMLLAHSSGANMVHERERGDPADFLESLSLAYRGNIPL